MRIWIAVALALLVAGPAQAETYDCEFGRYTYHQALPCDDPEGHVYYLRQEEEKKRQKEALDRLAKQWRSVRGDDVYMVLGAAEVHLKHRMKDPGSFKVVERHSVMQNNRGYRVILTYRARNGFGGMSVESAEVYLDKEMRGRNVVVLE